MVTIAWLAGTQNTWVNEEKGNLEPSVICCKSYNEVRDWDLLTQAPERLKNTEIRSENRTVITKRTGPSKYKCQMKTCFRIIRRFKEHASSTQGQDLLQQVQYYCFTSRRKPCFTFFDCLPEG